MTNALRVVLVSHNGYNPQHDELLQRLIDRRIQLFCSVGKDCERWEEAMDWLCIGADGQGTFIVLTTSHPDETAEEVIAFAQSLDLDTADSDAIEVIEV